MGGLQPPDKAVLDLMFVLLFEMDLIDEVHLLEGRPRESGPMGKHHLAAIDSLLFKMKYLSLERGCFVSCIEDYQGLECR